MKKILLTIVAVAITTVSFCQIKAFGDICFGMTKTELAAEIKNNKERYKLNFNKFYYLPNVKASTFYEDGTLKKLGFSLHRTVILKNDIQWISKLETEELFEEIEEVFIGTGYFILNKHGNYPSVMLMPEKEKLLTLMKEGDEKYIVIYNKDNVYNKYTDKVYCSPCFEIWKMQDLEDFAKRREQSQEKLTEDINKLL